MIDDPQDPGFDQAFHITWVMWWDSRGYAKPSLREDFERELRQGKLTKPEKQLCPHGESPLTCNVCYFNNYNK